jgi:hypothetical protein
MRQLFELEDEIVSIEEVGEVSTLDLEVTGNNLFYANGILTHNSAIQESHFDASHIAGGISKFNTADNVMAIFSSPALREVGEYELQLLKTRSSAGVGHKITLAYDTTNMRISNKDGSPAVKHPPAMLARPLQQLKPTTRQEASPQAEGEPAKVRTSVLQLAGEMSNR